MSALESQVQASAPAVPVPGSLDLVVARTGLDARRFAFISLCLAFLSMGLVGYTDLDYWWHLSTGQYIFETQSIPQTDPFSFTAAGKDWVAHEWLSELAIYVVQAIGGYAANVAVFTAAGLTALVVGYRTVLSFGVSRRLGVGLFFWAGLLFAGFWTVRPQLFTFALFSVFLAVLFAHRRGKNRLWLLPPLMVLWANLHLGFTYGLALVGLYAVATTFERVRWSEARDLKAIYLTLAGCVLATFLTPYPGELLLYPLGYFESGTATSQIAEWRSPDFHQPFMIPLAISILTFAAIGLFKRPHDAFVPLLGLVFTFLALSSVRNQPLFALVFIVVIAALREGESLREAGVTPLRRMRLHLAGLVLVAAALTIVFLMRPQYSQLRETANLDGLIKYPVAGADFIRERYPDARLFNEYAWGGFLIHRLYPQKVFIDGRNDFYGPTIMSDYRKVVGGRPEWQSILDKYGVDVAIVLKDSALAQLLRESDEVWRLEFTGEREAVFVRSGRSLRDDAGRCMWPGEGSSFVSSGCPNGG
ncbi:MAG TPA: hypothetical protein VNN10_10085 [Dehalococcoidia bacterium]|nr:hypothetical protein [Dehalococcoidia bacterium]